MKTLAFVLLVGCSSESTETPVVVDSAAVDTGTAVVDSGPVDTFMPPACLVSGACFDDYLAKHKVAASCFGHFGPGGCGTFDSSKTVCKWPDNTSFEILAVDGGDPTVVYKSKTGAECFRRLGTGDVVFPDGSKYKTTIAGTKLTVTCESSGAFTCNSVQACFDCGIDLRVCCM